VAIPRDSHIDFAKIALEMRETVARWYNAEIEIVDPGLREQIWDEFTNEYFGSSESLIWSGPARVQPLSRAETLPDLDIMQGSSRRIRIQVPYDSSMPLIRKGLEIRITNGGEDLVLEEIIIIVRSAINSSYGWNRTIECDADVKSDSGISPGGS
jgi:hypothetical protein